MDKDSKFLDFEALLTPISGENPSGKNFRYEPVYDQIANARKADDGLHRGDWDRTLKSADWPTVIRLSNETLSKQTKDVSIAVWLSEALTAQHGFAGFSEGLRLLDALLNQFWDTLYPEIEEDGDLDFRSGPLVWMNEKLPLLLKAIPLADARSGDAYNLSNLEKAREIENLKNNKTKDAQEAWKAYDEIEQALLESIEKAIETTNRSFYETLSTELDDCETSLINLQDSAEKHFGIQDAPGFTKLKDVLAAYRDEVVRILKDKPAPPPPPVASPLEAENGSSENNSNSDPAATNTESLKEGLVPAQPTPQNEPAPALNSPQGNGSSVPPPEPVVVDTTPQNREEAEAWLFESIAYLREFAPDSPVPCLALLAIRWGTMRENALDAETPAVDAPSSEIRQSLKKLYDEENWPALRAEIETALQETGSGWLDLQRYLLVALEKSGNDFTRFAAAVRAMLGAQLSDLPKLPEMEFSDSTPTTSNATRQWLATEFFQQNGIIREEKKSQEDGSAAAVVTVDLFTQAETLVKAGQFAQGLSILQEAYRTANCERERWLLKLQMSELCVLAQKTDLARPVLIELTAMIDQHRLESWEDRALNIRFWRAAYQCFPAEANAADSKYTKELAYRKLCQLDIGQAFSISKS